MHLKKEFDRVTELDGLQGLSIERGRCIWWEVQLGTLSHWSLHSRRS
jgi:hypothetical protein